MKPNTMRERGRFKCPFCGLEATIVEESDVDAVCHALPPCKTFLETPSALEYMQAVNTEIARQNVN